MSSSFSIFSFLFLFLLRYPEVSSPLSYPVYYNVQGKASSLGETHFWTSEDPEILSQNQIEVWEQVAGHMGRETWNVSLSVVTVLSQWVVYAFSWGKILILDTSSFWTHHQEAELSVLAGLLHPPGGVGGRVNNGQTFLAFITAGDLVCEDNWGRSQGSWEIHRDRVLSPLIAWVEQTSTECCLCLFHLICVLDFCVNQV